MTPPYGRSSATDPLYEDVRTTLRCLRHDLAGRIQGVLASLELADASSVELPTDVELPADIVEGLAGLRSIVDAWRAELTRLDHLLDGSPAVGRAPTSSVIAMCEAASSRERGDEGSGKSIPGGFWSCDLDSFRRAVAHAHKTLGRAGLPHLLVAWEVDEQLVLTLSVGTHPGSKAHGRVHDVFAGDLDAAMTEAESRLAGVDVSAARQPDGAVIRFSLQRA